MSIPLTEIERINALLPTELFAGSKDWQVGSIADRVDWLLTMYASAKEEVERLQSALEVQSLPFGVGGGLVAIKTLLSRDPCAHANTAIQMIDAILTGTAPPAQPEQEPVLGVVVREELPTLLRERDIKPTDTRLYTSPPQRKLLTDEEIADEWEHVTGHNISHGDKQEGHAMYISPDEVAEFARAVIAKVTGEKK